MRASTAERIGLAFIALVVFLAVSLLGVGVWGFVQIIQWLTQM